MRRLALITIALFQISASPQCRAEDSSACLHDLVRTIAEPSPLARDLERIPVEGEILKAGVIATRSDELSRLPDDIYVFCIDSKKRIIYSRRTPSSVTRSDTQHLVTHR